MTTQTPDMAHDLSSDMLRNGLKRFLFGLAGLALLVVMFALAAALLTYNTSDPSLNSAGGSDVRNLLGHTGSVVSDLLLQYLGVANLLLVTVLAAWGLQLLMNSRISRVLLRLALLPLAMLALATGAALVPVPGFWPVQQGLGGAVGTTLSAALLGQDTPLAAHPRVTIGIVVLVGAAIAVWCHGLSPRLLGVVFWRVPAAAAAATGRALHALFERTTRKPPKRTATVRRTRRREPVLKKPAPAAAEDDSEAGSAPRRSASKRTAAKPDRKKPGSRKRRQQQPALELGPADQYQLPSIDLLARDTGKKQAETPAETLEANARLLEGVLQDYKVHGEIVNIRTGPVVTLYELEPARGTRAARVIGLADDIARSMTALSVRLASVPGQNAIGIELPNKERRTVFLRDMLESDAYARTAARLPIALGRDIGGAPVVVDLASMPHLLIAGTTGSGKSVAVNTMILSLLYSLPPESCRMIMIDPKMLELSIYEGIPHLLTPVVTDPRKAVVALKWAVREMVTRYSAMSKLGVRNIDSYNARLVQARAGGEILKRRVQTGFDAETGKPVFEDEILDMTPLPHIVVVIDEVADLMLVAGKDIEAAVQRLAQMARAAGIHVIMATQRPSVDVITGTIKANFPTRISFQVTSKIDSRTILGEPGAEQLLGQGDMLYMAGGGRVTRVHGPFVSDDEVDEVVVHLRGQGEPEYDDSVTREEEVGDPIEAFGLGSDDDSGDALYDRAVAIVARTRKASTSFVQRELKIGYNRAATIIDRMENEGVISAANHVGKREVLVGSADAD